MVSAARLLLACATAHGFAPAVQKLQPVQATVLRAEKANYAVVGCGLPARGMGWFHGLQLTEGECASARLSDVVEPWFLGAGKDSDAGAEFKEGVVDQWTDTRFSDTLSKDTWSRAGPGPKLALIAGRTVDNPGFFRQALAAGATHILLEKPGAPSVTELQAMASEASEANVPVFMGFIKNISAYVEGALAAANGAAGSNSIETKLVSRNDYTRENLGECFERNSEGMLKNMAIHEIALACQFWAMRADNITDVICNKKDGSPDSPGCEMLTLNGKTDFASVDITLVNSSGTKVRVSADRCSGDGCCATVTDTSNNVQLYQQEMVGGERAKKVAADAAAHPEWFSYLYTQAEEYAKLKGVCATHALKGTTPPGVATIETACEALKLAEWLTPELQKKLKK